MSSDFPQYGVVPEHAAPRFPHTHIQPEQTFAPSSIEQSVSVAHPVQTKDLKKMNCTFVD